MPFQKGNRANPGGRPKKDTILQASARKHAQCAIDALVKVLTDDLSPAASKVSAANALLDRGYGKPPQDTNLNVTDDRPLAEHTYAELVRRNEETLRRLDAIASGANGEDASENRSADLHKLN